MKFYTKIINLFMVVSLLTFSFYMPKVNASEKTFGQVKKELAEFKAKYEENKHQQQLTKEEQEKIKNNINNIEITISNSQDEIKNLKLEIEKLEEDILEKEKEIANILSFYQISTGESAYLEYAFGASDFTDFIYRVAIAEQLTSYNNELVESYKSDIESSKQKQIDLSNKITELEQKQVELNKELSKLSTELESLSDDALSIEQQIELAESSIQLFTNMKCKDDETLETCARSVLPPDTTMWRPLKEGYLTSWAGPRVLEGISGTVHHGLDMSNNGAAYIDYPVYSIANGIVIYTVDYAYSGCGGRKVFIQHNINGKLYISAYWHLRKVNVKKEQVVTKDTVIGIMGGTESWDSCTTGAHLHLELSESSFDVNNFWSYRSGWLKPQNYINVPSRLYTSWSDRTTYFK